MPVLVDNVPSFPGKNVYSVKHKPTKKVVAIGFDNKMDAKDKRNDLSKDIWENWNKKDKQTRGPKPFPYIVIKGEDHPRYSIYNKDGEET